MKVQYGFLILVLSAINAGCAMSPQDSRSISQSNLSTGTGYSDSNPGYSGPGGSAQSPAQAPSGSTSTPSTPTPGCTFQSPVSGQKISGQVNLAISVSDTKNVTEVAYFMLTGGGSYGYYVADVRSPFSASFNSKYFENGTWDLAVYAYTSTGSKQLCIITVDVEN